MGVVRTHVESSVGSKLRGNLDSYNERSSRGTGGNTTWSYYTLVDLGAGTTGVAGAC